MPHHTTHTVFTVDDSELVRKNLGILLSETTNANWVGHAFSVVEAYKLIPEKNPTVVILDIQLKNETSFDLLHYLKEKHSSTTVIMLTNHATLPYMQKCKQLGAAYFLDKSSEFEKIPQILEKLLVDKD